METTLALLGGELPMIEQVGLEMLGLGDLFGLV